MRLFRAILTYQGRFRQEKIIGRRLKLLSSVVDRKAGEIGATTSGIGSEPLEVAARRRPMPERCRFIDSHSTSQARDWGGCLPWRGDVLGHAGGRVLGVLGVLDAHRPDQVDYAGKRGWRAKQRRLRFGADHRQHSLSGVYSILRASATFRLRTYRTHIDVCLLGLYESVELPFL